MEGTVFKENKTTCSVYDIARRRARLIAAATTRDSESAALITDLSAKGRREGRWSIRINDPWRIC